MRFRDLVTENDETIQKHRAVIQNEGFVWWGWWKKGNEVTPFYEFDFMNKKAENTPIKFLLLDSGQEKVYYATCSGIEFKNKKQSSPDTTKTPEYYNTQEYFAWFKFTQIEDCSIDEVTNFTYVQDDSLFFKDSQIDYTEFHGKKIAGVKELIQQNRTIWFVRAARPEDQTNEIRLINSYRVEPADFSSRFFECSSNTLIWLSDLHLPDQVFEIKKTATSSTLMDHIYYSLNGAQEDPNIGGLIITGDITSYGDKSGFQIAYDLITDLNRKIKVQLVSENIIFCPGNHDFKRKDEHLGNKEPVEVSKDPDSTADFKQFYYNIHHREPNEYFACGKKILLPSGRTIEIVALNSLMLQQYKDFEGHGYLSQEQLTFVENGMKWNQDQNNISVRIVIMHHHYLPTCYKENVDIKKPSSVVYDADRLMQWLIKNNVKILLHGHKHQSFISQVCYPSDTKTNINTNELKKLSIIGMGGTGAKDVENKFATITFEKDEIMLKFYRIYKDTITNDSCVQSIVIPL
jgi:predicted phosphodiesterase